MAAPAAAADSAGTARELLRKIKLSGESQSAFNYQTLQRKQKDTDPSNPGWARRKVDAAKRNLFLSSTNLQEIIIVGERVRIDETGFDPNRERDVVGISQYIAAEDSKTAEAKQIAIELLVRIFGVADAFSEANPAPPCGKEERDILLRCINNRLASLRAEIGMLRARAPISIDLAQRIEHFQKLNAIVEGLAKEACKVYPGAATDSTLEDRAFENLVKRFAFLVLQRNQKLPEYSNMNQTAEKIVGDVEQLAIQNQDGVAEGPEFTAFLEKLGQSGYALSESMTRLFKGCDEASKAALAELWKGITEMPALGALEGWAGELARIDARDVPTPNKVIDVFNWVLTKLAAAKDANAAAGAAGAGAGAEVARLKAQNAALQANLVAETAKVTECLRKAAEAAGTAGTAGTAGVGAADIASIREQLDAAIAARDQAVAQAAAGATALAQAEAQQRDAAAAAAAAAAALAAAQEANAGLRTQLQTAQAAATAAEAKERAATARATGLEAEVVTLQTGREATTQEKAAADAAAAAATERATAAEAAVAAAVTRAAEAERAAAAAKATETEKNALVTQLRAQLEQAQSDHETQLGELERLRGAAAGNESAKAAAAAAAVTAAAQAQAQITALKAALEAATEEAAAARRAAATANASYTGQNGLLERISKDKDQKYKDLIQALSNQLSGTEDKALAGKFSRDTSVQGLSRQIRDLLDRIAARGANTPPGTPGPEAGAGVGVGAVAGLPASTATPASSGLTSCYFSHFITYFMKELFIKSDTSGKSTLAFSHLNNRLTGILTGKSNQQQVLERMLRAIFFLLESAERTVLDTSSPYEGFFAMISPQDIFGDIPFNAIVKEISTPFFDPAKRAELETIQTVAARVFPKYGKESSILFFRPGITQGTKPANPTNTDLQNYPLFAYYKSKDQPPYRPPPTGGQPIYDYFKIQPDDRVDREQVQGAEWQASITKNITAAENAFLTYEILSAFFVVTGWKYLKLQREIIKDKHCPLPDYLLTDKPIAIQAVPPPPPGRPVNPPKPPLGGLPQAPIDVTPPPQNPAAPTAEVPPPAPTPPPPPPPPVEITVENTTANSLEHLMFLIIKQIKEGPGATMKKVLKDNSITSEQIPLQPVSKFINAYKNLSQHFADGQGPPTTGLNLFEWYKPGNPYTAAFPAKTDPKYDNKVKSFFVDMINGLYKSMIPLKNSVTSKYPETPNTKVFMKTFIYELLYSLIYQFKITGAPTTADKISKVWALYDKYIGSLPMLFKANTTISTTFGITQNGLRAYVTTL